MRRNGVKGLVVLGALAATVMGGAGAQADMGRGAMQARPHEGHGMMEMMPPPPEEVLAHMARRLRLTNDQQTKITAIITADREKSEPLLQKMAEYRQQLRVTARAATFDEAALRAIAVKQAQAEIELTVSHARLRSQVRALLTPEQQSTAEHFLPPIPGDHGPGPACHGEMGFDHAPPPPPPRGGERPHGGCDDEIW